jgi:EAL domain-containing protein (putative c-di-GMP-specific phosphodiesterase class I)
MGLQQAIESASDPADVMDRILGEVLRLVPAAEGAAVLLCSGRSTLTVAASIGTLAGANGLTVSTGPTLAGLALRSGVSQRTADARSDRRVDPQLVSAWEIRSLVCVPLGRHATKLGVLQITSTQAARFGPDDEGSLAGLAPFISTVVGAAIDLAASTDDLLDIRTAPPIRSIGRGHLNGVGDSVRARSAFVANIVRPGSAVESAVRDRVESVLAGVGPTIVLQPIVSLRTGQVRAVEALSRFAPRPPRSPAVWFAEAARLGLGRELELRAIDSALTLLSGIPGHIRLAVNAGPDTFCSRELIALLLTGDPHRITVELTEHVDISDFPALHRACRRLRAIGAEVAIDDTGTGFASLSLVLEVAPEVIKLDRKLCADIDLDPVRRALASALVTFGSDIGALIVAEGIETAAELEVLIDLGIDFGQGFHLARPGSLHDLRRFLAAPPRHHAAQLSLL